VNVNHLKFYFVINEICGLLELTRIRIKRELAYILELYMETQVLLPIIR